MEGGIGESQQGVVLVRQRKDQDSGWIGRRIMSKIN